MKSLFFPILSEQLTKQISQSTNTQKKNRVENAIQKLMNAKNIIEIYSQTETIFLHKQNEDFFPANLTKNLLKHCALIQIDISREQRERSPSM